MISIRFRDCQEIVDFSGYSVKEAREAFKKKLAIPDTARAKLNGRNIKNQSEPEVTLSDDDELLFTKASNRGILLALALLAAIAVTGGVFAFGYVTNSTAILITNSSGMNFVNVTANNSIPISWTPYGSSSGSTGNGTLWDIDTLSSNYTGDLLATVYLTNIDKLVKVYRGLGLFITVYDSAGNVVDLNDDSTSNISSDYAMLSLKNGVIDLNIPGAADVFTVFLNSGFFITLPFDEATWTSDSVGPSLYIELSQK